MSMFQDIIGAALNHWLPGFERHENFRPNWLFGMEIDFFFPSLGLAIEVNGRQHYKRVAVFQTGPEHSAQRMRDASKKRIILSRGLKLIILRQKKGKIMCGLQARLRESLHGSGMKFGHLPKGLRARWKAHSWKMHELAIGHERAKKERRGNRTARHFPLTGTSPRSRSVN